MPLYYLHIRIGNELEVDPDGTELPDIDAALAEAHRVARELLGEVSNLSRDCDVTLTEYSCRWSRRGQLLHSLSR